MKTNLLKALTSFILILMPTLNFAQAPALGATSSFALFTANGAFNNTGASYVTGDVGTYVGAFNAFPPGTLVGEKHVLDPTSASAASDVALAYAFLFAKTPDDVIGVTLGNGQVLGPGVHSTGAASTLEGNLTLDGGGDPNALFIIKIGGALSTAVNSTVSLTGSASLCNVYWQVVGAFTLGDNSVFRGTVVAGGAIELLEGSSLLGRGLTTAGAITLHNNIVTLEMSGTASIISAEGPTSLCEVESVTLSGNNGGTWSNGEVTPSITVNTGGDYFVTNTNACGSVASNHIIVTAGEMPVESVITAEGPTSLCEVESVTLSGNNGGTWSNGEVTASITVTTGGDYFVTNTGDCGSVTSNHILVEEGLLPGTAGTITGTNKISQTKTEQYCVPDIVNATSYVWNYSGTGVTIIQTKCITCVQLEFASDATSGILTVKGQNDCGDGLVSPDFPIVVEMPVAAAIAAGGAVAVYPNPFTTSINIMINDDWQIDKCALSMYNAVGEEIIKTPITKRLTTLDISNFLSGIYFYRVVINDKVIQSGRLIKSQ